MLRALGDLNGIAQARYNAAALSRISSAAAGKLHVPVDPALVGYSQFKHVAGVAAAEGQPGVNISKISILNTLIERLSGLKQLPQNHADGSRLSDRQIDALIDDYQTRIKNIVSIAKSNPYVLGGVSLPQSGALFSITA
ncbi:hypothetical protein V1L52_11225 [Treponema sp. HNW]|uniref:hypothetical protein n=1 Tax=Treponema sp. HNW TaxID=3116654 RepID=UPI003D0F67A7